MVHARLNSEVRTSRLVTLAATMLNRQCALDVGAGENL
jgi:hypothetical protein